MKTELDLVAMFQGLQPNEVRELTERIALAVMQTYEDFRASRDDRVNSEEEQVSQLALSD